MQSEIYICIECITLPVAFYFSAVAQISPVVCVKSRSGVDLAARTAPHGNLN